MLHRLCRWTTTFQNILLPIVNSILIVAVTWNTPFSLKTNPTKHINSLFPELQYLGSTATINNTKTKKRQFCIESIWRFWSGQCLPILKYNNIYNVTLTWIYSPLLNQQFPEHPMSSASYHTWMEIICLIVLTMNLLFI